MTPTLLRRRFWLRFPLPRSCIRADGNVLHSAHTWTLTNKGKLCLWILTELNAFVHCSDDVRFRQELVRDTRRGPTATPRVVLPCAAVATVSSTRNSCIFQSLEVLPRSEKWKMTSAFCRFLSAPILASASTKATI